MQGVNIDYRKIVVLFVLICAFYWLMLPGTDKGTLANKKVGKKEEEVPVSTEVKKEPTKDAALLYVQKLQEKDDAIEALKTKLTDAINNDNGSKKLLEDQIKEISAKSDNIQSKYKDLYDKYQKEIKEKATASPSKQKEIPNKTLTPFKGMKLVHLDLKGAPPTIKYLIDFMRKSKEYGATGFLIEYEDMFPWSGELELLARKNAYSKADLENVLAEALKLEMEVIPLIQTFGHLEFVLKHERFADLRAVKQITTSVCPLNVKSVPMIKKLIDQIIDLHPNSKWVHLGGDEVWNIKNCDKCHQGNYTDIDLYYLHMLPIMKYVKSKTLGSYGDGDDEETNLSPIIWDDMMRHWKVDDLKKMAEHVTPMVWGYVANLKTYRNFPKDMWDRYMEAFPKIFFASSFKGALKPWSNFVPIKQHLDNHLSWLDIYRKFQEKEKPVEGIAITGWSRFDHYGPLCELLPAGIPSMALCLAVLNHGGFDETVHNKTSKVLGFSEDFKIDITYFKNYVPEVSTYNGHAIYALVGALESAVGWRDWSDVRLTGWTRPYHVKNGHLSFFQMNETRHGLQVSSQRIKEVQKTAEKTLSEFFEEETVTEWITDKIEYYQQMVDTTLERVESIMKKNFS